MIQLSDLSQVISLGEKNVGGKAIRLGHMFAADLPVQDALVIQVETVEEISHSQSVPDGILEAVSQRFKPHGGTLAVRSSAVGEDGALSWAGQFTTKLFVEVDAVAEAILDCAKARLSEAVSAYAATHGVAVPPLALIVQRMVAAELSGVLFTTNPVDADVQTMVVEVVPGVGESLVSGRRKPHRYHVDAGSGAILSEEGPSDVALKPSQLTQLVSYGRRLRELFNAEQDVEWAIDGQGQLYLNQSRDITVVSSNGLGHLRSEIIEDLGHQTVRELLRLASLGIAVSHTVYSDQNIAELLTPHPPMMSFGLFTYCFAHGDGAIRCARNEIGYDIGLELDTGFFTLVGGQPRCSIVHDALTYRIAGIPLADYVHMINHYLRRLEVDPSLANYPEVVLYEQRPSSGLLVDLFGRAKAERYAHNYEEFFRRIQSLEDQLAQSTENDFLPRWQDRIAGWQSEFPRLSTLEELVGFFRTVVNALRQHACPCFVRVARLGFFAYARLRQRLQTMYGDDGTRLLDILTSGVEIAHNPNLRFNISLAQLRDDTVDLAEVIATYGHLSQHELEIATPRYAERPELLQRLAEKMPGNPLAELEANHDRYQQLRDQIIAGLPPEQAAAMQRDITMARTYLGLREVVKFSYLKAYHLARQALLRLNQILGWEEGLIFNLTPQEVFEATQLAARKEVAESRLRSYRANLALYVPAVIDSRLLDLIGEVPAGDEKILRGIGVTNHCAEGDVVILLDLQDRETLRLLQPGKVIVTVTTDPAWSPVIAAVGKQGGLITEIGGLLAHGAIYAREMGIAAVLNVSGATQRLRTGMHVRVNGPAGIVEILNQ